MVATDVYRDVCNRYGGGRMWGREANHPEKVGMPENRGVYDRFPARVISLQPPFQKRPLRPESLSKDRPRAASLHSLPTRRAGTCPPIRIYLLWTLFLPAGIRA